LLTQDVFTEQNLASLKDNFPDLDLQGLKDALNQTHKQYNVFKTASDIKLPTEKQREARLKSLSKQANELANTLKGMENELPPLDKNLWSGIDSVTQKSFFEILEKLGSQGALARQTGKFLFFMDGIDPFTESNPPSAANWLTGCALPEIYEQFFEKRYGYTTKPDTSTGDPDNEQYIHESDGFKFVQHCLKIMEINKTFDAIKKDYQRYGKRANISES